VGCGVRRWWRELKLRDGCWGVCDGFAVVAAVVDGLPACLLVAAVLSPFLVFVAALMDKTRLVGCRGMGSSSSNLSIASSSSNFSVL
jgi:hypothetical protein